MGCLEWVPQAQCLLCVQRALEDSVEKRTKDTYGPPMGKRLIMFLDDLNSEWGARVCAWDTF